MKERPILFSTDMVQALLDGRKTQTRRTSGLSTFNYQPSIWHYKDLVVDPKGNLHGFFSPNEPEYAHQLFSAICPYGKPGDLLYVRETWLYNTILKNGYLFKAGADNEDQEIKNTLKLKWKPSIHMPKDAARIWLQVKEVNVERLQDIDETDCIDEGIVEPKGFEGWIENGIRISHNDSKEELAAIYFFKELWKSINGPESWEANPWVWVVKFEVLSTTGRAAAYAKLGKEVPAC